MLDYERILGRLGFVFFCWLVIWGLHRISYLVFSEREEPSPWVPILCSLCVALFFAVPAWIFHGATIQRYGEEIIEVVEFEPTPKERNSFGLEIFLLVFIPSLAGALKGYRSSKGRKKVLS